MRIGVCDDEPLFLDMLREKLEGYYRSLDLRIDGFSSGEALVMAVEKDPFSWSLVFLDIEMPGMSGLEAARAVRDVNDAIPVILHQPHRVRHERVRGGGFSLPFQASGRGVPFQGAAGCGGEGKPE